MCARLSGSHSAFESTLNSSIVSYRIPDEEIEKCGFGIFEGFLLAASHYEYVNSVVGTDTNEEIHVMPFIRITATKG